MAGGCAWFVVNDMVHNEICLIVFNMHRRWGMLDAFRELCRKKFCRFEEADVKHIMALHVRRQPQPVGYWGDDLSNLERAREFWAQLGGGALFQMEREVFGAEQDLISYREFCMPAVLVCIPLLALLRSI